MQTDKTALITGASSGIGLACAKKFSEHGARVVLGGRRADRLNDLADMLETDSYVLNLDIRQREEVETAVHSLPDKWSQIDVLVNNAGVALGLEPAYEAEPDDIDQMIDTNIKGLLWALRAVVPGMASRGEGHVINIGSVAGREVYPGGSVYCATKAAVDAITQGLRIDLLGSGVRVTTVNPGSVDTEAMRVRFRGDEEAARRYYEGMVPLTADDVAEAVVWAAFRPSMVQAAEVVMLPLDQASLRDTYRGRGP